MGYGVPCYGALEIVGLLLLLLSTIIVPSLAILVSGVLVLLCGQTESQTK